MADWVKEARARFEKPPGWRFNTIIEEPIPSATTDADASSTVDQPSVSVAGRAVEVRVLAAKHLPLASVGKGVMVDCWCVVSFAGVERETARSRDPEPEWGECFTFELATPCGGGGGGSSEGEVATVRPGLLRISLLGEGGRRLGEVVVPAGRMEEVALAPKGWGEKRYRVVMAAEGNASCGPVALVGRGFLRCELLVSMRILEAGEWLRYQHCNQSSITHMFLSPTPV